jgi:CRP-like cAMP-binding protein
LNSTGAAKAPNVAGRNAILAGLSKQNLPNSGSRWHVLKAEAGQVLHEWGEPANDLYFPIGAVVSLFAASLEGGIVAAAIVGSEGVVGIPAVITKNHYPLHAVVQIAGDIVKLPSGFVTNVLRDREGQLRVAAYMNILMTQLAQSSICNNRHTIEQRLARWILAMRARSGLATFALTHEVLSQVLGTTRPVVTLAARTLKKNALIAYTRGTMQVLNPEGLVQLSCPCYEIVHRELKIFLKSCHFESHPCFMHKF